MAGKRRPAVRFWTAGRLRFGRRKGSYGCFDNFLALEVCGLPPRDTDAVAGQQPENGDPHRGFVIREVPLAVRHDDDLGGAVTVQVIPNII